MLGLSVETIDILGDFEPDTHILCISVCTAYLVSVLLNPVVVAIQKLTVNLASNRSPSDGKSDIPDSALEKLRSKVDLFVLSSTPSTWPASEPRCSVSNCEYTLPISRA